MVKYCRLGIAHFFLKYVAIFKRNIFELYLKYRESLLFPPLRFHKKILPQSERKKAKQTWKFFSRKNMENLLD